MPYHKIHYSSHVKLYTTLNNQAVQFVYAYQVNYLYIYIYINWLAALQDSVSDEDFIVGVCITCFA